MNAVVNKLPEFIPVRAFAVNDIAAQKPSHQSALPCFRFLRDFTLGCAPLGLSCLFLFWGVFGQTL